MLSALLMTRAHHPMHVLWQSQCMICGELNACFTAVPMHILWKDGAFREPGRFPSLCRLVLRAAQQGDATAAAPAV
ncbi:hypothetical protein J2S70_001414 [Trueperella bonasi]|uniref:Uncharacterized protein n=1 Tax=Trueperella bonasi TaxID=312286 RepID=A0ABT9NI13_9ACTO|nr:hypothetical protein [Trueperella bonasi]